MKNKEKARISDTLEQLITSSTEEEFGNVITSDKELELRKEAQALDHQERRFALKEKELEQKIIAQQDENLLKQKVFYYIFRLLVAETIAYFVILFLAGFRENFVLEESSLNIFMAGTLTQISAMAIIVVRSLFKNTNHDN